MLTGYVVAFLDEKRSLGRPISVFFFFFLFFWRIIGKVKSSRIGKLSSEVLVNHNGQSCSTCVAMD